MLRSVGTDMLPNDRSQPPSLAKPALPAPVASTGLSEGLTRLLAQP